MDINFKINNYSIIDLKTFNKQLNDMKKKNL